MRLFDRIRAFFTKSAPVASVIPPAPRATFFHPIDVVTYKCRRCGIDSSQAAKTPCRNAPRPRFLELEEIEYEPTATIRSTQEWADAFGPLPSTFRVPEPSPEVAPAPEFEPGGGTFGGGGASASWSDTAPASDPSYSSTPDSGSSSSESSFGGSGSDFGSSSSGFDSGSSSGSFGGSDL